MAMYDQSLMLVRAEQRTREIEAERDLYKEALERIAGNEFGLYFSERMRSCAKAALRSERYEWDGSA